MRFTLRGRTLQFRPLLQRYQGLPGAMGWGSSVGVPRSRRSSVVGVPCGEWAIYGAELCSGRAVCGRGSALS
jgi:hypothetical protein